jgi:hypothetical protein
MLLDMPRERTWKMGPIKRMEEFDPVFFQETFVELMLRPSG